MSDLLPYLQNQIQLHPQYTSQDIVKQCYQASFGADHLLKDLDRARSYFNEEYAFSVADPDKPLFEPISSEICRVNLDAWKTTSLSPDLLFSLFAFSAGERLHNEEYFHRALQTAATLEPAWEADFQHYLEGGIRPVHHSDLYRSTQQPRYRIVKTELVSLIPILKVIASLKKDSVKSDSIRKDSIKRCETKKDVFTGNTPLVIAIDGRAASGKTTAAKNLAALLKGSLIHMDDFFLPPDLRSPQRYGTPGGNVHYERFREEVLPHLRENHPFQYTRFDCSRMTMGDAVSVESSDYRIVEGSYSHHPELGNYADLKIFFTLPLEDALKRIRIRNGENAVEAFKSRWIPLEDAYFQYYHIAEKADLVIDTKNYEKLRTKNDELI